MDWVVDVRLFVSTTAGPDEDTPTLLYMLAPDGISGARSALSANSRTEDRHCECGRCSNPMSLGIETPFAAPQGKPKVAIMLPGPAQGFPHDPASETGLVIGAIDSGEAIRIPANHRIALNNAGSIYLKYNAETNQVEFYSGLALKHAIPMD